MARTPDLAGLALIGSGIAFLAASVYLAVNNMLMAGLLSAALGLVLVSMGTDIVKESKGESQ